MMFIKYFLKMVSFLSLGHFVSIRHKVSWIALLPIPPTGMLLPFFTVLHKRAAGTWPGLACLGAIYSS
jgi:hypothetical protein